MCLKCLFPFLSTRECAESLQEYSDFLVMHLASAAGGKDQAEYTVDVGQKAYFMTACSSRTLRGQGLQLLQVIKIQPDMSKGAWHLVLGSFEVRPMEI